MRLHRVSCRLHPPINIPETPQPPPLLLVPPLSSRIFFATKFRLSRLCNRTVSISTIMLHPLPVFGLSGRHRSFSFALPFRQSVPWHPLFPCLTAPFSSLKTKPSAGRLDIPVVFSKPAIRKTCLRSSLDRTMGARIFLSSISRKRIVRMRHNRGIFPQLRPASIVTNPTGCPCPQKLHVVCPPSPPLRLQP
jgi:hypothetical protein